VIADVSSKASAPQQIASLGEGKSLEAPTVAWSRPASTGPLRPCRVAFHRGHRPGQWRPRSGCDRIRRNCVRRDVVLDKSAASSQIAAEPWRAGCDDTHLRGGWSTYRRASRWLTASRAHAFVSIHANALSMARPDVTANRNPSTSRSSLSKGSGAYSVTERGGWRVHRASRIGAVKPVLLP